MAPKAVILMADYGNDPTEVAVPFKIFTAAGFEVSFATDAGKTPACDIKMLDGATGALLGASKQAKLQYSEMVQTAAYKTPLSWTAPDFDMGNFNLVFLPGGHDKGMRQYIDSRSLHEQLARYMEDVRNETSGKSIAAICHGVQVLATANDGTGQKSIIHDLETTALPGFMEQGIFWVTRFFLGDYYKTYGAGTASVQERVKARLDNPGSQWKSSVSGQPFTHRDPKVRYISARFPPDAQKLSQETVEMVQKSLEIRKL